MSYFFRKRRMMLQKKQGKVLPPEYQRVSHIESTGTQYIDTGVSGTPQMKIELTAQCNNNKIENLFGARTSSQNKAISIMYYDRGIYIDDTGTNRVTVPIQYRNDKLKFVISPEKRACYDEYGNILASDTTFSTAEFTTDYPLYIGTMAGNPPIRTMFSGYIFDNYFADENNVLIRDYMTVRRKSDNVAGLYDFVSGNFYPSVGTENFIAGDDI